MSPLRVTGQDLIIVTHLQYATASSVRGDRLEIRLCGVEKIGDCYAWLWSRCDDGGITGTSRNGLVGEVRWADMAKLPMYELDEHIQNQVCGSCPVRLWGDFWKIPFCLV